MKIIVICKGFVGDILFASSLAKKLKAKYPGCEICYQIPLEQPRLLLQQNPYIDQVISIHDAAAWPTYDFIINIPEVDQNYPATVYMQASAGIEDQSTEFDVYTVPEHDADASRYVLGLHPDCGYEGETTAVVAVQQNWEYKAYQCTKHTLHNGIGAPHRDIEKIVEGLRQRYIVVPVGFDRHMSSNDGAAQNAESFSRTASIIKHCDFFVGSEGGLSNLAAAVGTKCIITTDFIYQNYGPKGRVRPCEFPMMGPQVYYPEAGHVHLDPCLSDQQVFDQIVYNIAHARS